MPEISRYYKQERLTTSGGNVPVRSNIGSRQYRAAEALGVTLTQTGLDYLKVQDQAKYHDQYNSARVAALQQFAQDKQGLPCNSLHSINKAF